MMEARGDKEGEAIGEFKGGEGEQTANSLWDAP